MRRHCQPLKSSRNEQRAVICFLWAEELDANEIYAEMHTVYGNKCFTKPAVHDWCTKLLAAEKALLIRNDLAGMLRRPMPRLLQLMLLYGLTGACQFQTLFGTLVLHKTFWADEKMLGGQKFASDTDVQSVVRQWLGQQAASFFVSGIQKLVVRWDKYLNDLGQYVKK